jgi:hypothetical protein
MGEIASGKETARSKSELLRERSKLLFGNRDRLEVAVAVARSKDGFVNATDLGEVLPGWQNNRIRAQLIVLASVDLLEVAPRAGPGRVWYMRKPGSFWDLCLDLAERWDA